MTTKTAKKKRIKTTARINDDRIEAALIASRGNVSVAASSLSTTRNLLYTHIKKNPQLAQVLTDAREAIVDAAENALMAAVINKQGWAVCFTLKTLGRSRGYIERIETIGANVNIDWDDLTDDELAKIAAGEHPATVLANRRR